MIMVILSGIVAFVLAAALLAWLDQRREAARRAAERPAKARKGDGEGDDLTLSKKLELEGAIAALATQLRAHEDATSTRFRQLHGIVARARAGAPVEAPQLPELEPGETRPLTPELLAQLGGAAQPAEATGTEGRGILPPPPSRRWRGR